MKNVINSVLAMAFATIFSLSAKGQSSEIKRTWHWYFGGYNGSGIDFSSGTAVIDTSNTNFYTSEGTACISDTSGNLLFYTQGTKVWNRNHQIMPNGTGLLGGISGSSTQAALIIPEPGSSNLFYLFTVDETPGTNGMCYSIVDMNLNGGLGDVTSTKNIQLFAPSTEKLNAVNHCNDTDVWVTSHKAGTNEFYSYLLTPLGLNTIPVISPIGINIDTSQGVFSLAGQLKFSSDGTKAATATNDRNWFELFDFNSQTGVFSNRIILATEDTLNYGVEFSFNNRYLYETSTRGKLYQYDVSSNDSATIVNSKTLIYDNTPYYGFGQLQKAPDGKIYIGVSGSSSPPYKVSVINNPDGAGLACNFADTSFTAGGGIDPYEHDVELGLPNFNCSYFSTSKNAGCDVGINTYSINNLLEIFPNPSRDYIEISGKEIEDIQIINILGGICINETVSNSSHLSINVSSLARGIYFLKINANNQVIATKIIIN